MAPEAASVREAYLKELERTVPAGSFSPEALKTALAKTLNDSSRASMKALNQSSTLLETGTTGRDDASVSSPVLGRASLGPGSGEPAENRYDLRGFIGSGATCRVYAVYDKALKRMVAAKIFDGRTGECSPTLARLLQEAQTAASLEHPNILPVYDVDLTGDGEFFFTMRRIQGSTLGELIRSAQSGPAPKSIATPDDVVRILLRVCDALSYAHSRGVIHQDVKPDNILIGNFGEVLLLDWGSSSSGSADAATSEARPALVGTPAYMSPEQARRETIDVRSDVYGLGATFFHALALRHPLWAETPEEFWEKKRTGELDPVTLSERERIPHQLLAIALKALHASVGGRYQSVLEFREDLERYQEGRATSWLLFREVSFLPGRLTAEWVTHSSPSWKEVVRTEIEGSDRWKVVDGRLVGTTETGFHDIAFRSRIQGDIRVEWDVEPLSFARNLNCFVCGETRRSGYAFHVESYNIAGYCVLSRGRDGEVVDYTTLEHELEARRVYHLCMEKENDRVRLSIDGATIFDYVDPDPIGGPGHQTFGFENCAGNTIAIANVRVFYRPTPLQISPLAIADRYFEDGYFEDALAQYREIRRAYPETAIAKTAQFKEGKCYSKTGLTPESMASFEEFEADNAGHYLVPYSMYERSRLLVASGRTQEAEELYRRLAATYPKHPVLKAIFFSMTHSLRDRIPGSKRRLSERDLPEMRRLAEELSMWAREFGLSIENNPYLTGCAAALVTSGMAQFVEQMYPEQRRRCGDALLELGRFDELLERYPDQRRECATALLLTNRTERLFAEYPDQRSQCATALANLGRYQEVLDKFPDLRVHCARALQRLGRFEEVVAGYADTLWPALEAYKELDRLDEALETFGHIPGITPWIYNQQYRFDLTIESCQTESQLRVAEALMGLERYEDALALLKQRQAHGLEKCLLHLGRGDEIADYPGVGRTVLASTRLNQGYADEVLRDFPDVRIVCARALLDKGEFGRVLSDYPDHRGPCAEALLCRGELRRVLDEFPDQREATSEALVLMGRFDEVLAGKVARQTGVAQSLVYSGRAVEIAGRMPGQIPVIAFADLYLQRYEEILADVRIPREIRALALMKQGKPEAVIAQFGRDAHVGECCLQAQAMIAIRYVATAGPELLDQALSAPFSMRWRVAWIEKFLVATMLKLFLGDRSGAERDLGAAMRDHEYHFSRQLYYIAAFVLGRAGQPEFLDQPVQLQIRSRLDLAQALKLDFDGQAEPARNTYARYLAFPQHERVLDPALDLLLQWRITELNGQPPS